MRGSQNTMRLNTRTIRATQHRRRGLSLVEMLISLAITAMLLTATMVATNASFKAYASAAESASTQTATRMVINRLLTMVRTSTAHGPLTLSEAMSIDADALINGDIITCNFMEMIDNKGRLIRVSYDEDEQMLFVRVDENKSLSFEEDEVQTPLLGGVSKGLFHVRYRTDNEGVLVLSRGSIELTVVPDKDNTLAIETAEETQIQIVASTMPRRLDD